jgi:two-component system, NtrC family, nitrogen regulation sensor histidine kinase NtrY
MQQSRARIEYLQRIGAWQEMARRLAHEIKNPVTPIQLAVQEIHRRYQGEDDKYRKLLDSTLEIVQDEVGTLRRLVTEFSGFARLPQAELKPADVRELLEEQSSQLKVFELGLGAPDSADSPSRTGIEIKWTLPEGPAPAHLDRQMLRLALTNLLRNAVHAIRETGGPGRIEVTLGRAGDYFTVDVDDSGPGIPAELREAVFDPYVTTKAEGTGLGLAIAKKIVVEHGGSLVALDGPSGGARLRLRLPRAGTVASRAALDAREHAPASTRSAEHAELFDSA